MSRLSAVFATLSIGLTSSCGFQIVIFECEAAADALRRCSDSWQLRECRPDTNRNFCEQSCDALHFRCIREGAEATCDTGVEVHRATCMQKWRDCVASNDGCQI